MAFSALEAEDRGLVQGIVNRLDTSLGCWRPPSGQLRSQQEASEIAGLEEIGFPDSKAMSCSVPIVLFYHQVLRKPRPEHFFFRQALTVDEFSAAMRLIQKRYRVLTADEFYWLARNGESISPLSVLITFDDGFRNNLLAAEILQQLGMSATFFVLSAPLESEFVPWYLRFAHILSARRRESCQAPWGAVRFSNRLACRRWRAAAKEHLLACSPAQRDAELNQLSDELAAPPIDPTDEDYRFMNAADLLRLRELGMSIGGHSATHDNLTRCDDTELRREMLDSADRLAEASGGPIEDFSYPDGRFDDRVLAVARRRYRMAFAASSRVGGADMWRIPRRGADDCRDVRRVLSRWYPFRRRAAEMAKRLLN